MTLIKIGRLDKDLKTILSGHEHGAFAVYVVCHERHRGCKILAVDRIPKSLYNLRRVRG
jgi:hypothetical protein